jgi:hypothetical protein
MKFLPIVLFFFSFSAISKVWTFGIIGDAGHWNENSKSVRDSLLQDKVIDLIVPGDNLYDPTQTYNDVWKNWKDFGFKFPIVAIGNHTNGYEEEMRYFKMPEEYYSKVIGASRFIVLNSDNVNTVREQTEFLQRELEEANEQFIFLVYHHPPFTLRHGWREREAFHLATRPLIMNHKKKITSIIVGHDHIASVVKFDEIPVIVSGAVFESFEIPYANHAMEGIQVQTLWSSKGGFFWTRMDVNDVENTVWINFVSHSKIPVPCSVRISPRPLLVRNNCKS